MLARAQIVSRGLFGSVNASHEGRIGDVVVFSEGAHALYDALTASENSARMIGQHGSWTDTETSVPSIPLGKLD